MSRTHSGEKRTALATVVSDKMDKTVVVEIQRRTRHPLYGKVLLRSTKLKAHDENNSCRVGMSQAQMYESGGKLSATIR